MGRYSDVLCSGFEIEDHDGLLSAILQQSIRNISESLRLEQADLHEGIFSRALRRAVHPYAVVRRSPEGSGATKATDERYAGQDSPPGARGPERV